ncbi:hypothetical protein TeGR_g14391 [Tetraparma gracilis]|uniref:6-pyruvoyltetrahydropterin synthase n=1 Tax=Tetraparma gracilis TaxID=2962635 RepID=A0ABQ6N7W8_9STRA|nr:hypothetical protein TeGR_g14391 [Tetraparma gracilis]
MSLPSLPTPSTFSVAVAKQEFKFNLAHFVAFPGFRERLHGHNYHMSITLHSSQISKNDGYVLDFGDVKTAVRKICKGMNERVVIPTKSNVLTISSLPATPPSNQPHISLICEDGSLFVFPLDDCLLLPLVHSTVEEMTLYIYGRVLAELGAESLLARDISEITIAVAEAPGQEASVTLKVLPDFDVDRWEETGFNGAIVKGGEVKPCGAGDQKAILKTIKTSSLLDNAVAMVSKDGRENVVQASGTIRASFMSVVAYMFVAEQGHHQITKEEQGINQHRVVQHENDHALVFHWGFNMPSPVSDRDGVFRCITQKLEDDCIMSAESIEHDQAPHQDGVVRIVARRLLRFSPVSPTVTRFTATSTFDFRGSIPVFVSKSFTTPAAARAPLAALRYFNQVKRAEAFEAADAKELGQLLVLDTDDVRGKRDPDPLEAKLRTFVNRSAVLRGARSTCPWIEVMLKEVLRNRLRVPKGCDKALAEITEGDARKAGRAFANALVANATAEAAVDEWVMTYPALGGLEERYDFVRPMMNAVGGAILAQVAWGVKFRAFLGAGVSWADTASDAYMVSDFFATGRSGAAAGLLAMVGANLGAQSLIVYMQTQGLKKDKWRSMLFEFLTVITFSKPGVDAYRVASGVEQQAGAAFAPLKEMVATKMSELVFEAAPGLVLQMVALMTAERMSKTAILSILISVASTALTATTMSYDMETDPGYKKRNREWMGIIPDLGRTKAFATIFVMCACQACAKAMATALLVITNRSWFVYYFMADHALHLAYKIARRDIVYAPAPMPPVASNMLAPIIRVVFKVVVDFTGTPTFRVPFIHGGGYWLFSLASSQASVFLAVYLYSTKEKR